MNLETNCLLCRASVLNFVNGGSFVPWMEDVAASLCQILGLEKYLQQFLQTAVYCDACLFTIRDIDFTLQNVNALQQRLENSRIRVFTLLKVNYDEVGSGQAETIVSVSDGDEEESCSYEKVVTSIWTAMSTDKKPDLTEINKLWGNTNTMTERSRSRISSGRHRHKIVLSESLGNSDSDSDFYPTIEPLVKIETDFPVPRKRNRKNPTPLKVSKKNLAQRRKDLESIHKKSKKFKVKCKSAKCTFSTDDSAKYAKHLKLHKAKARKREKKSQEEGADQDDNSGNDVASEAEADLEGDGQASCSEEQAVQKKRRKTNQPRKLGTTKKYSTIKKFNCTFPDCKFRCDNEGRFQIHCRIHEGDETPYHCEFCKEAKFATNAARYYHQIQSCPDNPDRLRRKNAIRTPQDSELERRPYYRVESETDEESENETSTQERKELKCSYEGCEFSTTSERRYQCHTRVHEGHPLPYWCNSCDKQFPKAKHLNLHKHRNCGDVLTCPISGCDTVFPNRYAVKAHLSTVHHKEGKHVCRHCSKVFESSEEDKFQEHERTHEIREAEGRKFACIIEDCISKFTNSIDLRAHVLLEHESSASKCEACQVVLANPTSLKRHMLEQHGPPKISLKCDKCPYIGKYPSGLKLHMSKHSETKGYTCTVEGCGREFTWPSGLRFHMKCHTGEKKYKCTFENCGRAFVTSTKLKDHEETHSDRNSYFCDRCAKSFKAKKHLSQHFRNVHRNKPSGKSGKRQKLTEDGSEVIQGSSMGQASRGRKRLQLVSALPPVGSYSSLQESESDEINEANDVDGSPGQAEVVDVSISAGGWTFPQQYVSGHAQQFTNPFHQMSTSSLYFGNS